MISERRVALLLAFVTLLWAGTFIATKAALLVSDPIYFITVRFTLATLTAMAVWYKHLPGINRRTLFQGTIQGLFYGTGFFFQTWGLQYTTVSKSAFITGMTVIFVPFAHWLLQRKTVESMQLLGVALAASGLFFMTDPDAANGVNQGDLATLCGAFFWAFYIAYLDKISGQDTIDSAYSARLVIIQFAITGLYGLLLHGILLLGTSSTGVHLGQMRMEWTSDVFVALVYTALLGSLLATYMQTRYQQYVSPVKAGIIFTLEPVFAAVLALIFTTERGMTQRELIGAGLMLFAVLTADSGTALLQYVRKKSNR